MRRQRSRRARGFRDAKAGMAGTTRDRHLRICQNPSQMVWPHHRYPLQCFKRAVLVTEGGIDRCQVGERVRIVRGERCCFRDLSIPCISARVVRLSESRACRDHSLDGNGDTTPCEAPRPPGARQPPVAHDRLGRDAKGFCCFFDAQTSEKPELDHRARRGSFCASVFKASSSVHRRLRAPVSGCAPTVSPRRSADDLGAPVPQ